MGRDPEVIKAEKLRLRREGHETKGGEGTPGEAPKMNVRYGPKWTQDMERQARELNKKDLFVRDGPGGEWHQVQDVDVNEGTIRAAMEGMGPDAEAVSVHPDRATGRRVRNLHRKDGRIPDSRYVELWNYEKSHWLVKVCLWTRLAVRVSVGFVLLKLLHVMDKRRAKHG